MQLYSEGVKVRDIAKRLNRSYASIWEKLRRKGTIPERDGSKEVPLDLSAAGRDSIADPKQPSVG